jgi:hypothetical protein
MKMVFAKGLLNYFRIFLAVQGINNSNITVIISKNDYNKLDKDVKKRIQSKYPDSTYRIHPVYYFLVKNWDVSQKEGGFC